MRKTLGYTRVFDAVSIITWLETITNPTCAYRLCVIYYVIMLCIRFWLGSQVSLWVLGHCSGILVASTYNPFQSFLQGSPDLVLGSDQFTQCVFGVWSVFNFCVKFEYCTLCTLRFTSLLRLKGMYHYDFFLVCESRDPDVKGGGCCREVAVLAGLSAQQVLWREHISWPLASS